jgi:hypothetical protein
MSLLHDAWTYTRSVVIIGRTNMSDDKSKPVEDLKEGLGLLFRAAKGAVEGATNKLQTDKIEDVAKDAVKEVSRAVESVGNEIEKVVGRVTGSQPPAGPPPTGNAPPTQPPAAAAGGAAPPAEAKKEEEEKKEEPPKYDDGYAPEPPKGPRVG